MLYEVTVAKAKYTVMAILPHTAALVVEEHRRRHGLCRGRTEVVPLLAPEGDTGILRPDTEHKTTYTIGELSDRVAKALETAS